MNKDSIESIKIRLKSIEEKVKLINLEIFNEPVIEGYVYRVNKAVNELRGNPNSLRQINCILESTEYLRDYCISHSRSVVDDCNLLIKAYAWQILEEIEGR